MADDILTSTDWPAPAKINLFLHITGRRPDGYHLLQTVFQFIDYRDSLDFSINSEGHLSLNTNYSNINAQEDLVLRAAKVLKEKTGCKSGADISVNKKIPVGGGLGGGSSDAATTLVALNKLWKLGLDNEQLIQIGVKLGADVPVFINGVAAWGEGIGDELTPVSPAENNYLIVKPDCDVTTAEIFNSADLTRNTPPITIRDSLSGAEHNDCEPVVRRLYPGVAEALDWLGKHAPARMTGTGACVFAIVEDRSQAEAILNDLPQGWQGFYVRGLNRSPLLERLKQEN